MPRNGTLSIEQFCRVDRREIKQENENENENETVKRHLTLGKVNNATMDRI